MTMSQKTAPTILLVEDDPRIAGGIARAIAEGLPAPSPQLVAWPSASLAWHWLTSQPPPALIVIDQYLADGERGDIFAQRLCDDPRLANVPRIGYSHLPPPATGLFSVCLLKGQSHAGLLAQIVRMLRYEA